MITVKELIRWLKTQDPDQHVGVDDGGLTLQNVETPEVYIEVGGLPEEEEDEEVEDEDE